MDPMVIESPVGDNPEKPEKRRKQRERKKQTKNAEHMNEALEDPELANVNSEEILLEKVLTTHSLGGDSEKDLSAAETPSTNHGMGPMVIEGLVGDDSKRGEKRTRKKGRKKPTKRESDNIIQTHGISEDSNSKLAISDSETILLEKDLTEKPVGGDLKMDLCSAENPSEGHAVDPEVIERPVGDNSEKLERSRKKERKKQDKKADHIIIQMDETLGDSNSKAADVNTESINPEKDLTAQVLGGNPEMDPDSSETPLVGHAMKPEVIERHVGDNSEKLEKGSRKKGRKKQTKEADHIIIQMDETLGDSSSKVADVNTGSILLGKGLTAQVLGGIPEMDPVSAETPLVGHAMDPEVIERPVEDNSEKLEKRSRKKERKKQTKEADHIIIQMDETLGDSSSKVADVNTGSILLGKDLAAQVLGGNPETDPVSAETPSVGHAMDPEVIERPVGDNSEKLEKRSKKKERKKQAKKEDHIIIQMDETLEDSNSKASNANSESILLEEGSTAQLLCGNPKMDLVSAETPSEGHAMDPEVIERPVGENSEKLEERRQKKEKKQAKKAEHIIIQARETLEDSNSKASNANSESILLEKGSTAQLLCGNPKMDLVSAETPSEGHTIDPMVIEMPVGENSEKQEKKRQKKEKKQAKKAALTVTQTDETLEDSEAADVNLEKILLGKDLASQPCGGIPDMDLGSEGHAKNNNKATNEEEANGNLEKILPEKDLTAQTIFGNPKTNLGSEEVCYEDQANKTREKNMEKESHEDEGQSKIEMGPSENLVKGNVTGKNKRRRMEAAIEDESQNTHQAGSTEYAVEGNGTHEGKMKEEIKDVTTNVSSSDAKNAEVLGPLNATRISSTRKRKLLVLDLNGVLADIVRPPIPEEISGETRFIFGQAIVKRPFYDDFLNFCFKNFDVGIWSSRSRNKVPLIVDYLLGDLKWKLLFCWDMTQVTHTTFETIENCKKPLVLKELSKIWDNNNPRLGWRKGDYDKSNTLLLDDSPYKALLNPEHTAIFPNSYCYQQKDDNSLGPGGDLRVYLEGLLESENVQDYVERNPFGQSAITKENQHWGFYEKVVKSFSEQSNRWSRNTRGRWNNFQSNRWRGNTRGRWNNNFQR